MKTMLGFLHWCHVHYRHYLQIIASCASNLVHRWLSRVAQEIPDGWDIHDFFMSTSKFHHDEQIGNVGIDAKFWIRRFSFLSLKHFKSRAIKWLLIISNDFKCLNVRKKKRQILNFASMLTLAICLTWWSIDAKLRICRFFFLTVKHLKSLLITKSHFIARDLKCFNERKKETS